MKNWKLKQKFTIFLLAILLIGLTLVGGALATVLKLATENEIASQALILMETMNSVREYTNNQIKPELIDRIDTEFLPETIPAYSAREVFETLRQKNTNYRDFFYKEATINPSNLRDKADNFEKGLVEKFITNKNNKELTGFRSAPSGKLFYIARPIQITQASCLECHSTPEAAPPSVIERYGSVNGMGWKLNEIVGAQTISVPAKTVFERARQSFILIMAIISLVFIAVILLVNYLLNRNVIRPLNRMARVAEEVSTGNMDAEFAQTSKDEIGNLAEAFKRMKLSLAMAMSRLSQINKYKREQ
ncbi:histidine kinase HAMP region domain protein [Stanieria cyanosphaera PCC 7437]|uniref:histidine kinase n=1 Tax=Stanieria cyanosphaera (strain ATCC 29371 / PCC 7437) TaxID=111780 RepID=K9XMK7_STAC7|nr:DUF3365 domain-containing protein [Stanieria cyanosphaera]AFZ33728.1 histidine kinase HAMP region domain protein [Stanieria cyanosphaera PCC 7437]